jgi:hypothetical protein
LGVFQRQRRWFSKVAVNWFLGLYTQHRETSMGTSAVVVITAVALGLIPSVFGADDVAWSSPVDGLRLGIAYGSDSFKPTLRVLLQNVSSEFQDVVIGHEAGGPVYDSLNFIATTPDGKQLELLHRSLYAAIAGLVLPFSVGLNAGAIHELQFPLTDIIYASRTTFTLDALVKQGYSVRLRFEATKADANWAGLLRPWIGTLSSPEILPAH